MKKKLIAMVGVAALCFSMAASAFATTLAASPATTNANYGYGFCGGGYSLMWDQDGNFFDQSAFEENLDELIESGLIHEDDREYFMERYEWCAANGGGAAGFRGGCGGRGMGYRMYR